MYRITIKPVKYFNRDENEITIFKHGNRTSSCVNKVDEATLSI